MGRNVTSSPEYMYASALAAETITNGDFVVSTSIGNCYADGSGGRPLFTSEVSGLDNIVSAVQVNSSIQSGNGVITTNRSAILSNGNIVVAFLTAGNVLAFVIYTPALVVSVSQTTVATVTASSDFGLCALSGGGFALSWADAGVTGSRFATYTNAGAVTVAATTTSGAQAYQYNKIVQGTGGNILIVGANGYTALTYYMVVNTAGATVLAYTPFGTLGLADGRIVDCCAIGSGNFAICHQDYNTNVGSRLLILNNAGGTVLGFTLVHTSTNVNNFLQLLPLSNGNVVLVTHRPGTDVRVSQYTAAGAVVGSLQTLSTSITSPVSRAVALPAGAFVLFTSTTSVSITWAYRYDTTTTQTASVQMKLDLASASVRVDHTVGQYNAVAALFVVINNAIRVILADASVPATLTASTATQSLAIASANASFSVAATLPATISPASSAAVITYVGSGSALSVGIRTAVSCKAIPIGVSISTVSAAQTATVVATGRVRLRTALIGITNTDATAKGGIKITGAGNSALLSTAGAASVSRAIN